MNAIFQGYWDEAVCGLVITLVLYLAVMVRLALREAKLKVRS